MSPPQIIAIETFLVSQPDLLHKCLVVPKKMLFGHCAICFPDPYRAHR